MTLYKSSTLENYAEVEADPCEVRIEGGDIVVAGRDWVYRGKEEGPGHYRLRGEEPGKSGELEVGTATLHRFEGASVLVGNWKVGQEKGMWLIRLGS